MSLNGRNGKRKVTPRASFNYTDADFERVMGIMLGLTNNARCCEVLGDVVKEIGDEQLTKLFIHDVGEYWASYCRYFKGLKDVDTKWHYAIFDGFANRGGKVDFMNKECGASNFKYFKNCSKYANAHVSPLTSNRKYVAFLRFLSQTVTASIREKRREFHVDGNNGKK
jgi:hypothetical protein